MTLSCHDCQKGFEPPFENEAFSVWLEACKQVEEYLCLACAGLSFLKSPYVSPAGKEVSDGCQTQKDSDNACQIR